MPINEDFCHGDKKPIGKIIDGPSGNFHWVWPSQAGEGQNEWDASKNEQVLADYEKRGEKMEKLGITGTMVANDWDVCVADGSGIDAVKDTTEWKGVGETEKEERRDFTDKADAIREHDCIYCMACVSVCPPQAVLVDQSNLEAHEKAAGTFVKMESGSENPHAHD